MRTVLAALLVAATVILSQRTSAEPYTSSKWAFAKASAPYEAEKYAFDGYVDKTGKVRNGGLGCSGYASAVLHRMRDGDSWLKNYSLTVHHQYGDEMAKRMGLTLSRQLTATQIKDPSAIKGLSTAGSLKTGRWYFFNVREGTAGHVGFIQVGADGTLEQRHYSGIQGYEGLAKGAFAEWLARSQYRDQSVELYLIP